MDCYFKLNTTYCVERVYRPICARIKRGAVNGKYYF